MLMRSCREDLGHHRRNVSYTNDGQVISSPTPPSPGLSRTCQLTHDRFRSRTSVSAGVGRRNLVIREFVKTPS